MYFTVGPPSLLTRRLRASPQRRTEARRIDRQVERSRTADRSFDVSGLGDQADVAGQADRHLAGLGVDLPALEEGTGSLPRVPAGQRVERRVVIRVPGAMEPAP